MTVRFAKPTTGPEKNGLSLLEHNRFVDEAISGTKSDRPGLDQMLAAAEQGKFSVLIVESLSRLARSHVYASTVMMHLVYVLKIRIIGIDDGCDTNGSNWELLAGIKNILNEQYIRDLSKMVFRGQVENILQGFSTGDLCFGYDSVPVSRDESGTRRGHRMKMRYIIDEKEAVWVRQIFEWFVIQRQSMRWIAKELTSLGAPKDRRATTTAWHHASVQRLLSNKKYIGIWSWGEKHAERNPINGKVFYRKRSDEEMSGYTRSFPMLRLIDDDMFDEAQKMLRARAVVTSYPHPTPWKKALLPTHPLAHLIQCGICGGPYRTGGGNGQYMFCRNNRFSGTCKNRTLLRYTLAKNLVVREIEKKIFKNERWIHSLCDVARNTLAWPVRFISGEVTEKTAKIQQLCQNIEFLVNQIENGNNAQEIIQRLHDRRNELAVLEHELSTLCQKEVPRISAVDPRYVKKKFADLAELLSCDTPAIGHELLEQLLDGPITVFPRNTAGKSRKFLHGILRIQQGKILSRLIGQDVSVNTPENTTVLNIDFRMR